MKDGEHWFHTNEQISNREQASMCRVLKCRRIITEKSPTALM